MKTALVLFLLPFIVQGADATRDSVLATAAKRWDLARPPAEHPLTARGKVAGTRFEGGWLDAGSEWNATGSALTVWIRARAEGGDWTRSLIAKRGGHDRVNFNLFSVDLADTPGPDIGFEIRTDRGFLMVGFPVSRIAAGAWHDITGRYDGKKLQLLCDGTVMAEKDASGALHANTEPLLIGAETDQGKVSEGRIFRGEIERAAIWTRALPDAELALVVRQPGIIAAAPPQATDRMAGFRALRDTLVADRQRPLWHFLCPEQGNAMPFDPNGAIFWRGRYHLFYIFQRLDGTHVWGHASSIDLVHWRQHPTGLDVTPGDPDRGIFSGNAFLDADGVPTIIYHGVGVGNCIAQSRDELLENWEKARFNPIVPIPKPGDPNHGKLESWDPHGWFERGNYYAIFGGKKPALMKGPSLDKLTFQRSFIENDTLSDGEDDVSCPDFFAIGDRHALVAISHQKGVRWWTGAWSDDRFVAEKSDRITWPGGTYFAPESLLDARGRRIQWGWVLDPRAKAGANGWGAVMSMPVLVTLAADGVLNFAPAPELESLRMNAHQLRDLTISNERDFPELCGESIELAVEATPPAAGEFVVKVRTSPDGAEQTAIVCDTKAGALRIDFEKNSLDRGANHKGWIFGAPRDAAERDRRYSEQSAPFKLADGEPLRLRVLVDRSMIEIFANGRRYMVQRVFPTRADSIGVRLAANGGEARVLKLDAWELAAANPF
jgi:beta-fructofuranosidase